MGNTYHDVGLICGDDVCGVEGDPCGVDPSVSFFITRNTVISAAFSYYHPVLPKTLFLKSNKIFPRGVGVGVQEKVRELKCYGTISLRHCL